MFGLPRAGDEGAKTVLKVQVTHFNNLDKVQYDYFVDGELVTRDVISPTLTSLGQLVEIQVERDGSAPELHGFPRLVIPIVQP